MDFPIRHPCPLSYQGAFVWPILFAILAPPACLLLFIKNTRWIKNDFSYHLAYKGSWFWAFFWSIIFFPIAAVVLFLNGADIEETPLSG